MKKLAKKKNLQQFDELSSRSGMSIKSGKTNKSLASTMRSIKSNKLASMVGSCVQSNRQDEAQDKFEQTMTSPSGENSIKQADIRQLMSVLS